MEAVDMENISEELLIFHWVSHKNQIIPLLADNGEVKNRESV